MREETSRFGLAPTPRADKTDPDSGMLAEDLTDSTSGSDFAVEHSATDGEGEDGDGGTGVDRTLCSSVLR